MRKSKILILSLMFILSVFYIIGIVRITPNRTYLAQKGVLDLSKTDFQDQKIIELNGEWEFYYNHLFSPEDIQREETPSTYIDVPKDWRTDVEGNPYPIQGYATYRLIVKNIPNNMNFGLTKNNISNACKIYINGELVITDE